MFGENIYFAVISGSEALAVDGGSRVREAAEVLGYLVGKWVAIWQNSRNEQK